MSVTNLCNSWMRHGLGYFLLMGTVVEIVNVPSVVHLPMIVIVDLNLSNMDVEREYVMDVKVVYEADGALWMHVAWLTAEMVYCINTVAIYSQQG